MYDVSKNKESSISMVKTVFRHLITKVMQNFANFISSSIDWHFGEGKGIIFDKKNTTPLKMKWLLKYFVRPFISDKVNCYNFYLQIVAYKLNLVKIVV